MGRKAGDSSMSAPDFFWSRVDKNGPTQPHMSTQCWVWKGTKTKKGYGQMRVSEGKQYAHRYAHELQVGPISVGNKVCHRCDFTSCVRGDHLFSATQAENLADMAAKGRSVRGGRFVGTTERKGRHLVRRAG